MTQRLVYGEQTESIVALAERVRAKALGNLVAHEPDNTGYRHDLADSLDRLADRASAEGDSQRAQELFQRALAIREELTAQEPDDARYQHELASSLSRLGDFVAAHGDSPQAARLFERSGAVREKLARRDRTAPDAS